MSSTVRSSKRQRRDPPEPKREPFPGAHVDAVGSASASRLLQKAAGKGGAIAVDLPVGTVVAMRVPEDGAVARRVARVEYAEECPRNRLPVEAVGERAANELALERRMPAIAEAEVEEVDAVEPGWEDLDPRNAPQLRDDRRLTRDRHVEIALPETREHLGGGR